MNVISTAETSLSLGPRERLDTHSVGLSLPSGPGMVVGSGSSRAGQFSGSSQPEPRLLVRPFGRGLGCSPVGLNRFRPMVSGRSGVLNQCKGTPCGGERSSPLRSS